MASVQEARHAHSYTTLLRYQGVKLLEGSDLSVKDRRNLEEKEEAKAKVGAIAADDPSPAQEAEAPVEGVVAAAVEEAVEGAMALLRKSPPQ